VLGRVLLPEFRNPQAGRLDPVSVLLSLGAILPFIFGLKELARDGLGAVPVLAIVAGLALGALFVRRQHTLADPMVDLSLFHTRDFSISLASLLFFSLLGGATLLFITQYFQSVAGLSALRSGLALLPGMVAAIVSMSVAPLLARRIRPAYLISGSLVLSLIGLFLFTQVGAESGPAGVMAGFALMSLGGGPLLALGINLVMGSAPPEKAGAAASLPQISNELGSALGIATVGTLGIVVYRGQIADHLSGLPADAAHAAHESVAGATAAAGSLPGNAGTALLGQAHQAFVSGLHIVAIVALVVFTLIGVTFLALMRHVPTLGATPGGPPAPDTAPGAGAGSDTAAESDTGTTESDTMAQPVGTA
jgi:DHA2 family multidrug resistance protein-like MFS transporter